MSKLDEIEAKTDALENGEVRLIGTDEIRLLVRAARQLGAFYEEVMQDHNAADIRHFPCAICDRDMAIDLAVEELFQTVSEYIP